MSKSITNQDLLEIIQDGFQMTSERFENLESRMGGLEYEMGGLKSEVGELKSEVGELKSEVGGLKGEVGGLKSEVGNLNNRMSSLEHQYSELKRIVVNIQNEQHAQTSDIAEILDRLLAIEKRLPNITEKEINIMRVDLQALINWAVESAKLNGITLKLPKS